VVNGGISDIVAEVTALGISDQTTVNVKAAGTALGAQVRRLVAGGAKYVLVAGVYNLGSSPWAVGLGKTAELTALSNHFNDGFLISVVDLGANVLYVDSALYFNLVKASPSSYSLVNVTDKACTTPDATTCSATTIVSTVDYTKALFADGVYLTPVANRLFGVNAYTKLSQRW
jgi:phospholipase/lecithinase/hemolysin